MDGWFRFLQEGGCRQCSTIVCRVRIAYNGHMGLPRNFRYSWEYPVLAGMIIVFLVIKVANMGYRLSDTNIYFSTAKALLSGRPLYTDVVFTNLPLWPYIAAAYVFVTGQQVLFFFATSFFEVIAITLLLYFLLRKMPLPPPLRLLLSASYLFSYLTLAGSDHQTGIYTATLLAVAAYYAYEEKRYAVSGMLAALMLMTKAHTVGIAAAIALHDILARRAASWRLLLGFCATLAIGMAPTLISSFDAFYRQVFGYSLIRPQSADRAEVAWFLLGRYWLFVLAFLGAMPVFKRIPLLMAICAAYIASMLLFHDPYLYYYNPVVPFLVLVLGHAYVYAAERFRHEMIPAAAGSLAALSILAHVSEYAPLISSYGKITEIEKLVAEVKKHDPAFLYGPMQFTTLISHVSGVRMLGGIVDTTYKMYDVGLYDATEYTKKVLSEKTMVITFGRVEYGIVNGAAQVVGVSTKHDRIYNVDQIVARCKVVYLHPLVFTPETNSLNLLTCYDPARE